MNVNQSLQDHLARLKCMSEMILQESEFWNSQEALPNLNQTDESLLKELQFAYKVDGALLDAFEDYKYASITLCSSNAISKLPLSKLHFLGHH